MSDAVETGELLSEVCGIVALLSPRTAFLIYWEWMRIASLVCMQALE